LRRGRAAVADLQAALALPVAPERIEAYDISTIRGQDSVGSMVVFEQGRVKRADYRRFRVRGETGAPDDYAMMREVLARRLRAARGTAALGCGQKFARLPDLMVVDGGKGQLGVAVAAREAVGAQHAVPLRFPIAALAKERDWVYLEGRSSPLILPGHSPALHLLQRLRDEAHRFAQAYHHTLRARQARESILDEIPGVGPTLKRRLLSRFGGLARMRAAGVEELAAVPGVGRKVAQALRAHLEEKA
jgi:excinuclease ABC subunit C